LTFEALAAFEDERLEAFFDRGTLEADVFRGLVFEAGFGGAGSEKLAELVEFDLFADVELDQGKDGALQRGWGGAGGQGVKLVGDGSRGGLQWAVHERVLACPLWQKTGRMGRGSDKSLHLSALASAR
jgi:hypothetical protein